MQAQGFDTETLRQAVLDQLYWDSRLDSSRIQVRAENRKIILTGTVPSYPAMGLASADAFAVSGVTEVENRLSVQLPLVLAPLRDEEIKANIENALFWSPDVDASGITVLVTSGEVTLRDDVTSFWQKNRAQALAENVAGVVRVVNEIKVRPPLPIPDEGIQADIQAALRRSATLAASPVEVHVREGIVTLTGSVPDAHAYAVAETIAYYTRGVIDVRNGLSITAA